MALGWGQVIDFLVSNLTAWFCYIEPGLQCPSRVALGLFASVPGGWGEGDAVPKFQPWVWQSSGKALLNSLLSIVYQGDPKPPVPPCVYVPRHLKSCLAMCLSLCAWLVSSRANAAILIKLPTLER